MRVWVGLYFALALMMVGCAAPPLSAQDEAIADGRQLAQTQCAACHAIGRSGESPVPEAPVFRTILQRYNPEVLDEELIQGIRVAHPMPQFQFNPQAADGLVAYLVSVQEPAPAKE